MDKKEPLGGLDYHLTISDMPTTLDTIKLTFDRFSIPFFLTWGTCLGAVRDNSFIKWDTDLDLAVIMPRPDRQLMDDLCAFSRSKGLLVIWNLEPSGSCWGSMAAAMLGKIWVRLLILSMRESDWQMRATTCGAGINFMEPHRPYYDMLCDVPNVGDSIRFPARLFENLEEVLLDGKKFLVPGPPEEYLRLCYGRDWRVPKQHNWNRDYLTK